MSAGVEEVVLRVIARAAMVPASRLSSGTTLASLGIGSLEQIECVLAVEEELQVELDAPDLWQARTVQDVIEAVERARQTPGPPSSR